MPTAINSLTIDGPHTKTLDRRGRSPSQPKQLKDLTVKSYDKLTYFDDSKKQELNNKFAHSPYPTSIVTENFERDS